MTIEQIATVIGGLFIGVIVSLLVLWLAHSPVTAFGTVNLSLTVLLICLVGIVGLDALFKVGFFT